MGTSFYKHIVRTGLNMGQFQSSYALSNVPYFVDCIAIEGRQVSRVLNEGTVV